MRALSASELLNVWEWGVGQPPVEQALTLLASACPEAPPEDLAKLSIGQRDTRLLRLREWTFGSRLVSLAACPGCGEYVELNFTVSDILFEAEPVESLSLNTDGYELHFRLPDSSDLLAVSERPRITSQPSGKGSDQFPSVASRSDPFPEGRNREGISGRSLSSKELTATRQLLLERCLLEIHQDGETRSVDELPATIVDKVVEKMAQADPQADVQLALACPMCNHEWQALFDVVSFFWSEINAWAARLLRDVHALAFAYGWREADILAMSPWRRQLYLEMVRA
jgi:hypothetical protein